jgi:hypothetical protein
MMRASHNAHVPLGRKSAGLGLACLLFGCGSASGAVANAVLNTAIAASASAASRSHGGCYAACPTGTTCNGATGYCEELPCRGRCAPDETCVEDGLLPHCVRGKPADLAIDKPPAPARSESAEPAPPQ